MTSRISAAEEGQEQQEDVQDVEEDRRREQRRRPDVLRPSQSLEVDHGEAGEDHEAQDRVDQRAVRDPDEDRDDPEDDQREKREEENPRERGEVSPRRVARCSEAGDEERRCTARLPDHLRIGRGVVGNGGRGREPDEDAEGEEEADRELLGLPHRDVHAEQAAERHEEQHEPPAVGQIAAEVRTGREQAGRDGDEAHRLAEEDPRVVARGGRLVCPVLGDRHRTTSLLSFG